MLEAKGLSGSEEAGLDLVHNQNNAALFRDASDLTEPFHRGRNHTSLALNALQNDGARLLYTTLNIVKHPLHVHAHCLKSKKIEFTSKKKPSTKSLGRQFNTIERVGNGIEDHSLV